MTRQGYAGPSPRAGNVVSRYAVGGAVGLSLISRAVGLVREIAVIGWIGVHDFTDAYFAVSAVVLWIHNWSFGAMTLHYVPDYLAATPDGRKTWVMERLRRIAPWTVVLAVGVVAGYPWLEPAMLGGRRVLGHIEVVALAACIPITAIGGILYSRTVAYAEGIVPAARSLLYANVFGLVVMLGIINSSVDPSLVLPLTLLASQAAIPALLSAEARTTRNARAEPARSRESQVGATTAENVGFNLNALAHQAIAGWLPSGAVTLNAYAVRVLVLPLTGLMAPIQQRLLQRFAHASEGDASRLARRAISAGVLVGASAGCIAGTAIVAAQAAWPGSLRVLFDSHRFALVGVMYGIYGGVAFANQVIARLLFACGNGWAYAKVLIVAYAMGTALKGFGAESLGLLALPLGATIAEGSALFVLTRRLSGAAAPGQIAPSGSRSAGSAQ